MIILDTDVISETFKSDRNTTFVNWLKRQPTAGVYISVISLIELHFGASRLPQGKKQDDLLKKIDLLTSSTFKNKILPLTEPAAVIAGKHLAALDPSSVRSRFADTQIAAIALANGFAVATRNVKDFQYDGLKVINPWEA